MPLLYVPAMTQEYHVSCLREFIHEKYSYEPLKYYSYEIGEIVLYSTL